MNKKILYFDAGPVVYPPLSLSIFISLFYVCPIPAQGRKLGLLKNVFLIF